MVAKKEEKEIDNISATEETKVAQNQGCWSAKGLFSKSSLATMDSTTDCYVLANESIKSD